MIQENRTPGIELGILEIAREYIAAGLSIIPIRADGSKAPSVASWAPYQNRIARPEEINTWFGNGSRPGIAAIGGNVSGGLEIIDFDRAELFGPWGDSVKAAGGAELLARLVIVKTPKPGWHAYLRTAAPEGNLRLARRPGPDGRPLTTIETRGEHGYVLTPGCPPECHPSGRPYILKQGSLSQIPTITTEERRLLLDCARSFNEYTEPSKTHKADPGKTHKAAPAADCNGDRPGDDFNARATWREILEPDGWKLLRTKGDTGHWGHAGEREGATTNYAGSDLFYVFTTDAPHFEPEHSYSKFAAYAYINHGGDFQAAARELAARGYGKRQSYQAEEEPPIPEDEPEAEPWEPAPWTDPAPFYEAALATFPAKVLPAWLGAQVEALATATQTPPDLAGMLALAVLAGACAKKVEVRIRPGFVEPVNIYGAVTLPSANRKSAVFREMAEPIERAEAEEARLAAPAIARAASQFKVKEKTLARKQEAAAKANDPVERTLLADEAATLAAEMAATKTPVSPRLLADDSTPERLQTLLYEHNGRMAILSPEGDVFEAMAGRYSANGAPNLGVYLKGHSGDTLRIDRTGRPPEFIKDPALTLGLCVQPETILGLADKPGFRGRGLLARILYALPASTLGRRRTDAEPVPEEIRECYRENIARLLAIPLRVDEDGNAAPRTLELSAEAYSSFSVFMKWLEPQLSPLGELGFISDWGGKLAGAIARIAGLLHMAEHAGESDPWQQSISGATMDSAMQIGEYLIPHARAAFAQMGADPAVEAARDILAWITKNERAEFSKRELFNARRGRFKRAKELDEPLELLAEHGYIRERMAPGNPKGGRPSQCFEVNPATHKGGIA